MKTTFLILLLTGINLLAQTPPTPPTADSSDTNNAAALRRALRRTAGGQTNAPTIQPAAVQPAAAVPAPDAAPEEPTEAATPDESGTPSAPAGIAPAQAAAAKPATPAPVQEKPPEEIIAAGQINFTAAELNQVLTLYANLVNRTILRAPNLASPAIVLKTQTPLTKSEAIQALDAVFALSGIAMINIGEKFVKAVPIAQAEQEGQKPSKLGAEELPEMGQYVTHILQLKTAKPSELAPILQAFSKTKNVLPVDSSQILVIRDYTENVKRMLEIIDQIDVSTPSEFVSEVIPIKYALAGDIASALNSLSGSSSGGTTVGSSPGAAPRVGAGRTGYQQPAQLGGQATGQPGAPAAAGTASSTANFSQRLQAIIRRASASGDVQVLGQTKIIADERTNSLLVFATRQDMAMIKDIVSKLDVVLAQVLIESIIMEVSLDDSKSVGFSYLQRPRTEGQFSGVGAIRNTTSFLNPANFSSALTNVGQGILPSGFSYLARWGDDLDVTAQAIAQDNRVNILSRPRIQTSHAVPAQLFIGNTVPYITGTTYGDFSGVSSRSQYTEKRVGITLDVLPLINPDGLVVMDIQQVIQQLGPTTSIDGNAVPTTTERSASSKVAVKDRDTIILGGFMASNRSTSKSGVPFLKDIPLLGFLFRSTGGSNQRVELIVMMRPTVLKTPEIAAKVATSVKNESPAIRQVEHEEEVQQEKKIRRANKKYGTE